jgi:nitrogen regulatory protein PII
MKLVTAIVRPEKLDELIETVVDHKGRGLTASTVRGFGQQFGEFGNHTGGTGTTAGGMPEFRRAVLLTKVRLDILVPDHHAEAMVDAIAEHARTGAIGDGKIWMSDVESILRVRTGERDEDAI